MLLRHFRLCCQAFVLIFEYRQWDVLVYGILRQNLDKTGTASTVLVLCLGSMSEGVLAD